MIFFTSDTHWGHKNILLPNYDNRPWDDIDEHDLALVERYNSLVNPDDICYFLGDLSLGMAPVEKYGPMLNGTKYIVPGNHCKIWKKPNSQQLLERYRKAGFEVLGRQVKLEVDGIELFLSHLPYTNHDPRYVDILPKDDGHTVLLHGHVHLAWKVKGRQINVGVPQWDYYPVSIKQIKELINAN